jgi:hypothetical protein
MALRPSPSLQVEKPRGSNNYAILYTDGSEGHCSASVSPSQSSIDIADDFGLALRNRAPLIKRTIDRRSGHQSVNVAVVKRFETNVLASQQNAFCFHVSSMQ